MEGHHQIVFCYLATAAIFFQPATSVTVVDPKWIVDDISPIEINCIRKPQLIIGPTFTEIDQTKPYVINSHKFESNIDSNKKCQVAIRLPKQAEVYIYFRTFDIPKESPTCGGDYLRVRHSKRLYKFDFKFCGQQWEGKLVKLNVNPKKTKLTLDFSSTGKGGFQLYVFGKYANLSKGLLMVTTGIPRVTSSRTEVFDLENGQKCLPLEDYPIEVVAGSVSAYGSTARCARSPRARGSITSSIV